MLITNLFNARHAAILLGVSSLVASGTVFALPHRPTVISGSVNFDYSVPGELTVTSSSDQSIVGWSSFSIGTNESVTITLPDSTSTMLNRVTGDTTSNLLGSLQSNATAYLINPNGVVIGPEGTVNANTFLASSLDTLDSQFLAGGNMDFTGVIDAATPGTIVHYGTIEVGDGDVILLGYQVSNTAYGLIEASSGTIALGAGQQISLQPTGAERITILSGSDTFADVTGLDSSGTVNSLISELKADANMYSIAISHSPTGWVNASGTADQSGLITLRTDGGVTNVNGPITAQNSNRTGGTVYVLGGIVNLQDNAYIDTSAHEGGGDVFIGGGFQGADGSIPNATTTTFTADAAIYSYSSLYNNGGQVVVWADDSVTFCGNIYADGGVFSGNGGLVEFGGVNYLQFAGNVYNFANASSGTDGLLLLDSNDIVTTPCN
jgi:filamentous hemagglutinin family protein